MKKNLRETAESSAILKVGYKESMVFREEFFTQFFFVSLVNRSSNSTLNLFL